MTLNDKYTELEKKFQALQKNKTDEELLFEEEDILRANYLSEIERIRTEQGIKKKDLANNINTSASYITQVFRGDKPLNFTTIAKIQRALKIRFHTVAMPINEKSITLDSIPTVHQKTAKVIYVDFKAVKLSSNKSQSELDTDIVGLRLTKEA